MLKTENFQSILDRAKKHYNGLPNSKKKRIKEELDHGKGLLDSNDQMKAYIALYGGIHQAKLEEHLKIFRTHSFLKIFLSLTGDADKV